MGKRREIGPLYKDGPYLGKISLPNLCGKTEDVTRARNRARVRATAHLRFKFARAPHAQRYKRV